MVRMQNSLIGTFTIGDKMKKKICPTCKEEKEEIEGFGYHNRKTGLIRSICKDCLYTIQKKRWKDRKRKVVELFGGKCSKCGYNKNLAALQFHHLDPTQKEYSFSQLKLYKWEIVIKELKKCIMLCSNCHAEEHWPDYDIEFLSKSSLDDNNSLNDYISKEPKVKLIKSTGRCPICQKDVFGTKYCSLKCSALSRRKTTHPRRKTLAKLMENMSFCAIGRKYNVSDNAVRKWAKRYDLLS